MENYIYTKNRRTVLSKGQRDFYEKNGFIVVPHLIDHDLLDECRRRFLDICDGKVDSGGMTVMRDSSLKNKNVRGEYLINKIQDFLFDEVLFKYATEPSMVDVVESIVGSDIVGMHSMLINKPPDAARETSLHPLHQDLHYFPFRPAEDIVASWTAMETINEQNGCLYVIPGSHKGALEKHDYADSTNMGYHGVFGYEHVPKVNLIMEKGDTVFFHPVLLHGSGPNLSKGFRKAISVHYANSNCHFMDVRGTTQENIAREFEALAVKKRGVSIKYEDFWRYKSRVIKGKAGNFSLTSNL